MATKTKSKKKGQISAEGRERIAAAQRKRWAAWHKEQKAKAGKKKTK